jgi:kinetochore protein Mis13/DSN1
MTTLVQIRQPLQVLSMSNQPERRRSKRLSCTCHLSSREGERGRISDRELVKEKRQEKRLTIPCDVAYEEQDGDFYFTRGTKRQKTIQPEPIPEDEIAPVPAPAARKPGRPPKASKARAAPAQEPEPAPPKRASRRSSAQIAVHKDEPAPPPPQRTTRRQLRSSSEIPEDFQEVEKPKPKPKPKAKTKPKSKAQNGSSKARAVEEREPSPEPAPVATPEPMVVEKTRGKGGKAADSKKIALPFSDTPIMNRNKEMRRKTGGRRSSLGMRGRRASSLIDNGHSAIPHRTVDPSQFFKHIEASGLSEPRRMKQLLTWCGERALIEKPPLGSADSRASLGGKMDPFQKTLVKSWKFEDRGQVC